MTISASYLGLQKKRKRLEGLGRPVEMQRLLLRLHIQSAAFEVFDHRDCTVEALLSQQELIAPQADVIRCSQQTQCLVWRQACKDAYFFAKAFRACFTERVDQVNSNCGVDVVNETFEGYLRGRFVEDSLFRDTTYGSLVSQHLLASMRAPLHQLRCGLELFADLSNRQLLIMLVCRIETLFGRPQVLVVWNRTVETRSGPGLIKTINERISFVDIIMLIHGVNRMLLRSDEHVHQLAALYGSGFNHSLQCDTVHHVNVIRPARLHKDALTWPSFQPCWPRTPRNDLRQPGEMRV